MIIIGFILTVAGLFTIIGTFVDAATKAAKALSVVVLCVGILSITYNCMSPIVIESERVFITNDYQSYDINIDSERVGVVKEVQYDAVFPLAIVVEPIQYYFMEFVGE